LKRFHSLSEVRSELTAGTTSCRQLVAYYLGNIERQQHLNAFLEVWPDEARAQADAVDAKLAAGTAGPETEAELKTMKESSSPSLTMAIGRVEAERRQDLLGSDADVRHRFEEDGGRLAGDAHRRRQRSENGRRARV